MPHVAVPVYRFAVELRKIVIKNKSIFGITQTNTVMEKRIILRGPPSSQHRPTLRRQVMQRTIHTRHIYPETCTTFQITYADLAVFQHYSPS